MMFLVTSGYRVGAEVMVIYKSLKRNLWYSLTKGMG